MSDRLTGARSAFLLAGLIGFGSALALDIDDLNVTKEGDVYQVQMTFDVAARPAHVVEVLTDFQNPHRLSPDVTGREIISREDGVTRVHTELRGCLLFFCRNLEMTQDVTSVADTVLAVIVPGQSDFRSGRWLWTITAINEGTSHVAFEASMEPDVFIPPLFGKTLIRRMLEQEVLAIATNLEAEATR